MPSRTQRKRRRVNLFIVTMLFLVISVIGWVFGPELLQKDEAPPEPRWNETNSGIDITAEERAVEAQLPGLKQSRLLAAHEAQAQKEREDAIRKEEREKAAKEAEEAAAQAAKEEAEAQALAEQEAAEKAAQEAEEEPQLDPEMVAYDSAMHILFSDLASQTDFLSMLVDGINGDLDYAYSMEVGVGFTEGALMIYETYERMNSITPPARLADAHAYIVESTFMLYEGCLKISDGASYGDPSLIEAGLQDFGMSINYLSRAQQQWNDVLY